MDVLTEKNNGYTVIRISSQFLENNNCTSIEQVKSAITQRAYYATKRNEYAAIKKATREQKKLKAEAEADSSLRAHIADVLAQPLSSSVWPA